MQDGILYVCPMTNCLLKHLQLQAGPGCARRLAPCNQLAIPQITCTTGIEKQTVVDGQQMLLKVQQLQHE